MKLRGKVWKFNDHVNTDDIIPACYLNMTNPKELALHCMETLMPDFSSTVKKGDIIVAGENFGCGSSREHAPIAIKACGISLVAAKSFARIFLRNSINIGLSVIEFPETDAIEENDEIEVDLDNGKIHNVTSKKNYVFAKYPEFLQQIISNGGLMKWVKEKHIK